MEVREGYKNTEVGIIPEDWDVKELGDFLKVIGGGAFKSRDASQSGVKWLKISNVDINKTNWDDESFLPIELIKDNENFLLKEGDYVLALTRPILDRKLKIARLNLQDVPALLNQRVGKIEVESQTNIDYTYYLFQKFETISGLLQSMAGTDPPNLSNKGIYGIKCGVPPTKAEQTAIATALSDADALINSLEKLIAKKRNIKQGAMQQLLKPKEGWEELSIFQIADFKKELFDDGDWIESEYITDKGIRLIQTGNIGIGTYLEKESKKYINEDSFKKLRCKQLKIGDLLICRLAEPAGRACILPFIGEDKVITSVDVSIYRPNEETVNRQFLNQIFTTNNWFNTISELCGGTTHKRISRGALGRVKIQLPNIQEQTRIATILSDMDTEIQALETKLEKYRKIKLGMMQNLLTGKIRLI